jgi:hypothetical protein
MRNLSQQSYELNSNFPNMKQECYALHSNIQHIYVLFSTSHLHIQHNTTLNQPPKQLGMYRSLNSWNVTICMPQPNWFLPVVLKFSTRWDERSASCPTNFTTGEKSPNIYQGGQLGPRHGPDTGHSAHSLVTTLTILSRLCWDSTYFFECVWNTHHIYFDTISET